MDKVWILTKKFESEDSSADYNDTIGVFEDRRDGEEELDILNKEFLRNNPMSYEVETIDNEDCKSIEYKLQYSSFTLELMEYDVTPKRTR